jgi:hypothetical protein
MTAEEEAAQAARLQAIKDQQERLRVERLEERRRIRQERLYSRTKGR